MQAKLANTGPSVWVSEANINNDYCKIPGSKQSSVGDYLKSLHLVGAVIAFVQIHVQRPGIQDVLLAFSAVEGLALRPY